tara:strand:+ start:118 stop:417 length:300 start_codon:yes stop_codon:yes gene_type:complete
MSEGKIIDFKTHLKVKKSTTDFCLHRYVEIDEEKRQVECTECGMVVSPYDFLVKTAYEESSSFDRLNAIKKELAKKEKRYKFLLKEIDRLNLLRKKLTN